MYHHDSRDLAEATSEAAKTMKDKLHKEIEKAKSQGQLAMDKVLSEIPRDRYRMMSSTKFDVVDQNKLRVLYRNDEPETVHVFALAKICEAIGIPRDTISKLLQRYEDGDNWGPDLAVDILNKHFAHAPRGQDRRMIRSVQQETRGFLSDSYARLHPGALIDTFAKECQKYGLLPYGGHAGATKFVIRATLDRVIEPVPNEVLGIGVVFKESPFGDGASELSLQLERMWCTNKAISTSELRKVHLGSKAALDVDEAEEAYRSATNSMCAEMRRSMRDLFAPESLHALADGVRRANEAKVSHDKFEAFLKKHLTREDVDAIKEKYRSTDITDLPAGDTWWRASNAISWYAGQKSSAEQAYDLQKLAGLALQAGTKNRA
jgi:hypothetical protein